MGKDPSGDRLDFTMDEIRQVYQRSPHTVSPGRLNVPILVNTLARQEISLMSQANQCQLLLHHDLVHARSCLWVLTVVAGAECLIQKARSYVEDGLLTLNGDHAGLTMDSKLEITNEIGEYGVAAIVAMMINLKGGRADGKKGRLGTAQILSEDAEEEQPEDAGDHLVEEIVHKDRFLFNPSQLDILRKWFSTNMRLVPNREEELLNAFNEHKPSLTRDQVLWWFLSHRTSICGYPKPGQLLLHHDIAHAGSYLWVLTVVAGAGETIERAFSRSYVEEARCYVIHLEESAASVGTITSRRLRSSSSTCAGSSRPIPDQALASCTSFSTKSTGDRDHS